MLSLALLLSACGPKEPVQPAVDYRATPPQPLSPRPFQLPELTTGTLSNGVTVVVVENHEVPLVYVQMEFEHGSWTDPADRPGLASVTMDMLNEGAGGMSATALSGALRSLASELSTGTSLDGASISLKTLKANLAPSLDLLATVALEPDFPDEDWEVMQARRLQNLDAARQDPRRISRRAWSRLMYGEQYAGNLTTTASYQAITPDEMRGWYSAHVVPASTTILVGGDTTLAEIQPLLEARFGSWEASGATPTPPTADSLPAHEGSTIYLIDKPGAPQSVVRVGQFVGQQTDELADAFQMANMAVGGQFIARINMNLREDKGWTYGTSSWVSYNRLPGLWTTSASVVTPHTADAIKEILTEIRGPTTDRPLTEEELQAGKGALLGKWPLRFENPHYILDSTVSVRRYNLPDDWLTSYPARIRAVDLEAASAAWSSWIAPDDLTILVVGDAAQIQEDLASLELPVIVTDADGNPLQ